MLFSFSFCYSQNNDFELKLYRQEISFGVVKPFISSLGFSCATEPKFTVLKKFAIGLRLEGSIWFETDDQSNSGYSETFSYSGVPTIDYYFIIGGFRPFVGIGYGLYYFPDTKNNYEKISNTGILARVGFEGGHFRLGIQYNHISRNPKLNGNSISRGRENWAYFDLKLGVVIGSGNKSNRNSKYYRFN